MVLEGAFFLETGVGGERFFVGRFLGVLGCFGRVFRVLGSLLTSFPMEKNNNNMFANVLHRPSIVFAVLGSSSSGLPPREA